MSDEEEDSVSEGFSASEEEWKPNVKRGGESSDDDDSDFEDVPIVAPVGKGKINIASSRKREPKSGDINKQASMAKKRKPTGQSLRTKLYNKYRPPPKTISSPSASVGSNSPSASTSRAASKNVKTPNESSDHNNDSSSESSVEDYFVDPSKLDLQSSFFDVAPKAVKGVSPVPNFDCNAGITNMSDSGSEDNESSDEDQSNLKAFDFRSLLEKTNSLERMKVAAAKENSIPKLQTKISSQDAMDVNSLLALGENQNNSNGDELDLGPSKLSKTKSTRVKRHTKTRPTSTIIAGDTDDSDWEEVADGDGSSNSGDNSQLANEIGKIEILVELPSKRRKEIKQQQDLELAFKRKLNRDLKERQLLLHKATLLCCLGRSYYYNHLINHTTLMQASLKLLPSKNSYPPERGTEIKYYQSLVTWFKTAIQLQSPNLYPEKTEKNKKLIRKSLLQQIESKQSRCKQDMVLIFIILMRAMGLQCRLVVNLKPLPIRPAQEDLIKITVKPNDAKKDGSGLKRSNSKADDKSKAANTKHSPPADAKNINQSKKSNVNTKHVQKKNIKANDEPIMLQPEENESMASAEERKSKKMPEESKPIETMNTETKQASSDGRATTSKKVKTRSKGIKKEEQEDVKKPIVGTNKKSHQFDAAKENKRSIKSEKSREEVEKIEQKTISPLGATGPIKKLPSLSKLKRSNEDEHPSNKLIKTEDGRAAGTPVARRTRLASSGKSQTASVPKIAVQDDVKPIEGIPEEGRTTRTRMRSQSPKLYISPKFLKTDNNNSIFTSPEQSKRNQTKSPRLAVRSGALKISPEFLKSSDPPKRILRPRQKSKDARDARDSKATVSMSQLDGADDSIDKANTSKTKRPQLSKIKNSRSKEDESDEDFEPTPSKKPKPAPLLSKSVQKLRKDRRVLSTDDEAASHKESKATRSTAADMWVEVWSDVEEQWICIDIFKGKLHSVDAIRKSASNLVYVFAFQNDLSIKDVSARYCANWATTLRKVRVDNAWLTTAIRDYFGQRTNRDILEDQELRRIHEEKPMPTTISEYKDHPLYALERHLLKFHAIYPPDAPTLGFIRGEPVYSRDCVHTLHSRDIWLKQARTVKLGEEPYKIVKARPKWDRFNQTVIKDQPLEIFGYWQTVDYEPPTAENGLVPRNAYGNVELFKECMLPKKTVHLRLTGLNRICKKLGIDCANAVVGFDFHQGACHPTYDGFVICEEFADQVTAAWYQDQEEQERKEQEKYETRVYGNWKKLIRGLLIREKVKKKYNL